MVYRGLQGLYGVWFIIGFWTYILLRKPDFLSREATVSAGP